MTNEKNSEYLQKTTKLIDLVNIANKSNYSLNAIFTEFMQKFDDMIFLNNLIYLYKEIEIKVFDYLKKELNTNIENEMELDEKNKKLIENELAKNDILINKDILINTVKKYILRYCICDNNNKKEILKNYNNINDIINKKDIWDKKIIEDTKFGKECENIKIINGEENYILKYCFNIFFEQQDEIPFDPNQKLDPEEP